MGSRIEPRILAKTVVSLAFSAHHSPLSSPGPSERTSCRCPGAMWPPPPMRFLRPVCWGGGGEWGGRVQAGRQQQRRAFHSALCLLSHSQPCIFLAFLLALMVFHTSPLDKEFFVMLYCLPYTTLVHHGTCPFCTCQYRGFNKNSCPEVIWGGREREQSLSVLCLLRVTPLCVFFDQHLSAQNVYYFGPTPKPSVRSTCLLPRTTARAYSDVIAGARAEQATQP